MRISMNGAMIWQWVATHHYLLAGIVGAFLLLLFAVIGLDAWIKSIRDERRRKASGERPHVYAIGSKEHNAQIVKAVRTVNEQLAPQGKRVPERVAIDIITM